MVANANCERRGTPWRIIGWGFAAFLLLLPAVAMQFTSEMNWDETDFIFAGVMIGAVGLVIEAAARMSRDPAYRAGMAAAALAAFLLVWVNLAVGMIGSEDNPHNLFFGGALAVAAVGAVLARFRSAGMARAMIAAAVTHGVVGAFGLFADMRGGIWSLIFATPWLLSAALFRKAARQ